jgi:NADH-quinone oxidoreductase subunit N
VSLTAKNGREGTKFADLAGLWQRAPVAAAAFVIFIVSLIGVPPTAGFFGKLLIFQDALRADLVPLAIVLAVNSAISAYYYIGMILAAFVADPEDESERPRPNLGLASACLICAAGTVALAFFITPLLEWLGF